MLTIYKASAGSGKTYTLTMSFLKMIFADPKLFEHILAITFTNKATEEMKVRLMDYLSIIADNKDSKLITEVSKLTGITHESVLRTKAADILKSILYNYSGLHIQTIDSFFQQVIRRFARESGIQAGYNVEMDTAFALSEAVEMLFAGIGGNTELTQWLTDFAIQNIESGKSWNFRQETEKLAHEIFSEKYSLYENVLVDLLRDSELRYKFMKEVNSQIHYFEDTLAGLGKNALACMDSANLTVKDFSYGYSGVAGFFAGLASRNKFDYGTRVMQALDDVSMWFSKKTPADIKERIGEITERCLMAILRQTVDIIDKQSSGYITAKEIRKNFFVLGLLGDISARLRQFRSEENKILISDVNQLLNKIIEDNDAPFIYEKTGTWLQHFLLDEFQDTSALQWKNILPLLKNSLASGNSNLVVGDVKQSIYRWRNSDWNLLNSRIHDDLKYFMIQIKELETNWRSSRNVINFNNAVFHQCPLLLQSVFESELSDFKDQFKGSEEIFDNAIPDAYSSGNQLIPENNPNSGFVRMRFFDKKDQETGLNFKEKVLKALPGTITSLLDKGFAQSDIALLTRTKDEAKEVAAVLLQMQGVRVVSEESLSLNNSLAVRILLSAMKYLHDENDVINKMELQANYLVFTGTDLTGHQHLSVENNKLFSMITACRKDAYTLYEIAENIIRKLKLHSQEGDFAFLQTFLDMLLQFVQSVNGEIADFIRWWDLQKNKTIQLPENLEAVRLMTIHKAKGLEFGVVIIPFCNWDISHRANRTILWCNTAGKKFDTYPVLPFYYKNSMKNSLFAFEYFKETLYSYIDNLNLLYVAFTRAVDGLMVFSEKNKNTGIRNVSGLLWNFLEQADTSDEEMNKISRHWNKQATEFSYGELAKSKIEGPGDKKEETNVVQKTYISSAGKQRIRISRNAGDLFEKDTNNNLSFLNYGRFMHKVLSEIIVKSDIDKALNRILFEGEIGAGEKELLRQEIFGIIEIPGVEEWFDGSYKVMNELPILDKSGEIKRPDRVMISGKNAVVVDFKFGAEQSAHKQQVKGYKDLLLKMGYDTKAWLLYAGEKKRVQVKN